MLRIRQGSQERYVWPVHLPGWLALGWRVVGAAEPAPISAATGDLLKEDDAKPASTRGRSGRRRKDVSGTALAPASLTTEDVMAVPKEETAEADELAEAEPSSEASDELDAAAEVPVLTALPDDLFDDPLT
jgi:hypothetical protein